MMTGRFMMDNSKDVEDLLKELASNVENSTYLFNDDTDKDPNFLQTVKKTAK